MIKKLYLVIALIAVSYGIQAQPLSVSAASSSPSINAEYFSKIYVDGPLRVHLTKSDTSFISIKSDAKNLGTVYYYVEDNTLYVASSSDNGGINVELGAPEIQTIILTNAASISNDFTMQSDTLYLELTNAASVNLNVKCKKIVTHAAEASMAKITGTADSAYIYCKDASSVDASALENTFSNVQLSGASSAKLNTTSTVAADFDSTSSIQYSKEPINKKINSKESVWIYSQTNYGEQNEDYGSYASVDTSNSDEDYYNSEDYDNSDGDSGDDYCYCHKFIGHWQAFEFGITGYTNSTGGFEMPAAYDFLKLNYAKSINFNLNLFQYSMPIISNKFGFVTGLGLQWYNYRFDNNIVFNPDSNHVYAAPDTTVNKFYKKSKLTNCFVSIPLLFEYQTQKFNVAFGVTAGILIDSYTKNIFYTGNSAKVKYKTFDNYGLQPFKLDASFRIGFNWCDLYVNYSLIQMYKKNHGPELYPFTVGVSIPFGRDLNDTRNYLKEEW